MGKENTTIVGDGSTQDAVEARVKQIKNVISETEQDYEKEKLNERVARLSGGVAIIQVGAQTETELKEKKLRVEDALNATKAAVEEGIVIGGGSTLLKLAQKVDAIRDSLQSEEQKVGCDIVRRALGYPLKLIANNAGVNGSVVMQKVLEQADPNIGYNAATGERACLAHENRIWINAPFDVIILQANTRTCWRPALSTPPRLCGAPWRMRLLWHAPS